jgi:hypothetical protein
MFRFLIDTCVWLDIAKDPRQESVVSVIEELVRKEFLGLIVPTVVIEEFERNRDRIARESAKSLSAHFRLVKEAVGKVGGDRRRMRLVLSHLDDVNHKIPIVGGNAANTLDRIHKLLKAGQIVGASEGVKLRAADRAIAKRAPFHRGKNAMADAIVIETYGEYVRGRVGRGTRFAFVSHKGAQVLRCPRTAAVEPRHQVCCRGYRVLPKDYQPIVGFVDGWPNLYLAAMHSGITLSPLIGHVAAAEILDGISVDLLRDYRPSHFA